MEDKIRYSDAIGTEEHLRFHVSINTTYTLPHQDGSVQVTERAYDETNCSMARLGFLEGVVPEKVSATMIRKNCLSSCEFPSR